MGAQLSARVKRCGAEMLGTFGLVFAGTGAIIINQVSNGAVTHVGIALTFGLIVLAMFCPPVAAIRSSSALTLPEVSPSRIVEAVSDPPVSN